MGEPKTDPVIEGHNVGPDLKHYPFGWLGEEYRIGNFFVVEVREDRDNLTPDSYVIYRIEDSGKVVRTIHSWEGFSEALVAVAMMAEGVNTNTIAHTVPVLVAGMQASRREER